MVNLGVWSYELKSRMDEGRKTDRPRCPKIFQIPNWSNWAFSMLTG